MASRPWQTGCSSGPGRSAARHARAGARHHGPGAGAWHHHQSSSGALRYAGPGGIEYKLNLIDTPGHVDFSYEVSRVGGLRALLVVDATQGVEAQTLANAHLAIEAGLEVIPVINKIDLPAAEPDRAAAELAGVLGGSSDEVIRVSAKTGEGRPTAGTDRQPGPASRRGSDEALRALVFDSYYDIYRGVVCYLRWSTDGWGAGTRSVSCRASSMPPPRWAC